MPVDIDDVSVPKEIRGALRRLEKTYDLERMADKGQNGYLFFARNTVLGRDVAIKFYYWRDGDRGHMEPKALSAMRSSSIVEVLDATKVGDEWAMFVTPYCANGDVDTYQHARPFYLREALRFTQRLLDGVSTLHEARFVHRDLKPENILVSDRLGPLIADFGSVRALPEGRDEVPGSGHAILYRPPESFDLGIYDKRGDIYQCGLVLYQVLGGRLAYNGVEYLNRNELKAYSETEDDFDKSKIIDDAIEAKVTSGKLFNMTSLPFFVPSCARRIVKKATSTAPEKRYQSASEMMAALNSVHSDVIDWGWEAGEAVARLRQGGRIRIAKAKTEGLFFLEKNNGKGWRRIPRIGDQAESDALKTVASLC